MEVIEFSLKPYIPKGYLCIGTQEEIYERCDKNFNSQLGFKGDFLGAGAMFEIFDNEGLFTPHVWMKSYCSCPECNSILVHECMHCAFAVLRIAGIKLNKGSEECFSYLLEHIVWQLLDRLQGKGSV